MPETLKAHKIWPVFDTPLVAPTSAQLTNSSLPIVLPDYSQGSHPRRMPVVLPVVQADSMQLLTAEQALAAAANGTAIVRTACVRAIGDSGIGFAVNW